MAATERLVAKDVSCPACIRNSDLHKLVAPRLKSKLAVLLSSLGICEYFFHSKHYLIMDMLILVCKEQRAGPTLFSSPKSSSSYAFNLEGGLSPKCTSVACMFDGSKVLKTTPNFLCPRAHEGHRKSGCQLGTSAISCLVFLVEAQRVSVLAVLNLKTLDGLVCAIKLGEVARIDAGHVVVDLELAGWILDPVVADVAVLFEELKALLHHLPLQIHCLQYAAHQAIVEDDARRVAVNAMLVHAFIHHRRHGGQRVGLRKLAVRLRLDISLVIDKFVAALCEVHRPHPRWQYLRSNRRCCRKTPVTPAV
eukprot:1117160-Pleurochrysis_carterae.AAC.1